MSDLDAEDVELFHATAGTYGGLAGDLSTAATDARRPSPLTPGGIYGRTPAANDLTKALMMVGDKLDVASQGVTAYSGATTRVGTLYQNHSDLSTQLLGSVINANGRADQATEPGGN
jgi:hypothetical protein